MDRPPHDYAAMAFAQQQQQAGNLPGQQYGFPPQHQQYPPSVHGPPLLPHHPSQQYPFQHQQHPQQMHPHSPHSHLLHIQQQPQPPPSFPPHIPPHLVSSPFPGGPYDSTPPPAPPPPDPELRKRIDKLVEYVAKNGPGFEAMVCEKEHKNPEYSFLFGGEGHAYYRYKLFLFTRGPGPFGAPFLPLPGMHPPPMNPTGVSGPMMGQPQMHQPPFPHYDQQKPYSQPYMDGRLDYDQQPKSFRGLSGPLPSDIAMELNNVVVNLTGTKESIKGAKAWFMQRSPFAPALAEALRDRVFTLDDYEKQLHIVYLANDILFDSFQRRVNPHELDNEALAFKPVLGSMLARIYHHPQNKEENQSRLQKIVQFWASKEVYDHETIRALEGEMIGGPPSTFPGAPKDFHGSSVDLSSSGGLLHSTALGNLSQWQQDKQSSLLQEQPDQHGPSIPAMPPSQPFLPHTVSPIGFAGAVPLTSSVPPASQPPIPPHALPQPSANVGEKLPPYPLFPPGLIPGMVKKLQIGSGVPYSPMSPLDIPTVIPPSDIPESDLLERVSKFFKEISEVNPSEGPMSGTEARYEDDYQRESPVRTGGACIPPPSNLQSDTERETETASASFGSGRLGLGATANPNEASQYDDVYTSYRKHRSTNYHTSMSVRAGSK